MEENEPDFISPHRCLKELYLLSADYPHYLAEAKSEAVLMHDASALSISEATEKGFATGGGKGLLEALSLEQQKLYDRGQFSPYYLAETYSIRGRNQEALGYLKIALRSTCRRRDRHGEHSCLRQPAQRARLSPHPHRSRAAADQLNLATAASPYYRSHF
jgi:hypothetical protein